MYKKSVFCLMAFAFFAFVQACGGGSSVSTSANGNESVFQSQQPSFSLSADFPSDIVIPDVDGMRSTAFVVSTSQPAAVVAIDIDANPMKISSKFNGVVCPSGSGIPSMLFISSAEEGFLITSNSLIFFNPTDGDIYYLTSLTIPVNIGDGFVNSDGSVASSNLTPSFPAGITRIGDEILVSTSNYINMQAPALAAPGTILFFKVNGHLLSRDGVIVTSGYNPTGMSDIGNGNAIVVNSGVIDIINAKGLPSTESSVDILDVDAKKIVKNISMGMASASFYSPAVTLDKTRAFVGSSSFGNAYEIDLINKQVLHGVDNPISVTSGNDFITDVVLSVDDAYLFAASFEKSAVYPFDMRDAGSFDIGDPFVVGFPSGVASNNPSGANTGAGPIAVRPGTRGVDYDGADLFVLTGHPGTLVAITTDAPERAYAPTPSESPDSGSSDGDDISSTSQTPPPPPVGDSGETCQGFAQSVKDVNFGDGAGFGQDEFPNVVLGPPQGKGGMSGGFDVLSLGKRGEIILDMGNCGIVDGDGPDFIVFENPFYIGGNPDAPFAELGEIAVSGDGVNFVSFPCESDELPYTGCAGWHPVYSNSSNGISPFDISAAGGDAFDLSNVGVNKARYIRIRDISDIGGGTTAGFDLDAVSVINGEIR